ncbi:MAG TPA: hypothetical protein PKC28_05440 [Bdellovibrionales bacterium]|nr:hypothetical protein [Bdellovibrionales bacterium]
MKFIVSFFAFSQIAFAAQPVVPKVDLDWWNHESRVYDNNCYNYSTNRATDSFAQPGEASGKMYDRITCKDVYEAASQDLGLEPVSYFPFAQKSDKSLIALVVGKDWDYHWYRRGDDNMWTHKPGGTPATELDESGNKIANPETADRGNYDEFCGYFRISNFPTEKHEQNAGAVRVGDMNKLPEDPQESEVVILKYSGRPNPRMKLREAMMDSDLQMQIMATRSAWLVMDPTERAEAVPTKRLDGQGILVIDREGLVFEKGARVYVR